MMTLAFGSVAWGVRMPQSINNDKDLKAALKAARTPEDHERIATYCKVEAETLDAEAAAYEHAAKTYRKGPVVKNVTAPNTAARYDSIAKRLREKAQADRELAASGAKLPREGGQGEKGHWSDASTFACQIRDTTEALDRIPRSWGEEGPTQD
jgi:hypothetical protein